MAPGLQITKPGPPNGEIITVENGHAMHPACDTDQNHLSAAPLFLKETHPLAPPGDLAPCLSILGYAKGTCQRMTSYGSESQLLAA